MSNTSGITDRQQDIIDAARMIISSNGIDRLTIRAIADRLKLTEGALYRHFKSKAEILSLLADEIERTLLKTVETAAGKEVCALGKLESVLLSHISYAEQRKGLTFIVINETLSLNDGDLRKKMYGIVGGYMKKIQNILEAGIREKEFRNNFDVSLASLAFFGLVQSTVTFWALSGCDFSIGKQKISNLFDIYKEGIVKR